jgi:hypothetical protein
LAAAESGAAPAARFHRLEGLIDLVRGRRLLEARLAKDLLEGIHGLLGWTKFFTYRELGSDGRRCWKDFLST